jgi:hypothetical protein
MGGGAMKYRGFEYTIIQGYERGTWRWSVTLKDGQTKAGNVRGKPEAQNKVQRVIDNAIKPRKKLIDYSGRRG